MVAAALPANPSFFQRLAGLDQAQRLKVGFGIAVFIAVAVVGLIMGRQAEWRVLYANLPEKDGGAIVAQLAQMNVPYKIADGSGAILVPADKVYDMRLRLASQGLPKGSVTGYELMDTSSRLGMTQFQERLTFQRGLEGELTRSIQSLGSVQGARVHIALPNQNGFFREQQKPSASVLVSLHAGRMLDRAQVAGIVHLVASSVPELDPGAVSVLDDTGKLLSTPRDGNGNAAGIDAQQLQYAQQLEQLYSRRILDLLEPVVGPNNVRAQVTADLDFSLSEQTSESYKPNGAPDSSAIRSQQTLDSNSGAGNTASATGVPGATSNQPPNAANTTVNGNAQNLTAAGGASSGNARRESTVNYEVDKTVRVVRAGAPSIKRLTAAVVVNHQSVTDAKGKVTTNPWNEQQIEKMTALVREAIGYSKDRNDSVNLMNAPFTAEKVTVEDLPLWKQPQVQDLVHSLAWPIGTLLLAALVLTGFVKPAMKMLATAPVGRPAPVGVQVNAIESEAPVRPQLDMPKIESALPTQHELAIEDARKLTRDNPAAVANIVKGWINGEA